MSASFDTYVAGRKTYDVMVRMGQRKPTRGIQTIVFSRLMTTMPQAGIARPAPSSVICYASHGGDDLSEVATQA